ncbi:MAG: hypothetical protein WCC57_09560 [Paracoccaceae bacterium]
MRWRWWLAVLIAAALLGAIAGVVMTFLQSMGDPPPGLGADLPFGNDAATVAFDQRLKAEFPMGTPEADLRTTLVNDGFILNPTTTDGYARKVDFPCELTWQVNWDVQSGDLTAIKGQFNNTCH